MAVKTIKVPRNRRERATQILPVNYKPYCIFIMLFAVISHSHTEISKLALASESASSRQTPALDTLVHIINNHFVLYCCLTAEKEQDPFGPRFSNRVFTVLIKEHTTH